MSLAGMLALDEDALICDLAETYQVLDMWALPVSLLATLASGLREDSRIKMELNGYEALPMQYVIARIADEISLFRYSFADTKETPQLITELMKKESTPKAKKLAGFESGEAFMAEWNRRVKGEINGR